MFTLRVMSKILLFTLISMGPCSASFAEDNHQNQNVNPEMSYSDAATQLNKMQVILDKIKGKVSASADESSLAQLNDMASELAENTWTLSQYLVTQSQKMDAQLAVLGPSPQSASGVNETSDVVRKRHALELQKSRLDAQIQQANSLHNGASRLSSQILNIRRDQLKTQLTLNTGSVFSVKFWQPLYNNPIDGPKILDFVDQIRQTIQLSWSPGWRAGTVGWCLAAILVMVVGRRYMEEFLAWVSTHKLPEGRLRRSFLANVIAITSLLAIVLSFNFLAQAFSRHPEVPEDVQSLVSSLVTLSVLSGLIAGLGRAFLSTRRPSWRLAHIEDQIALAMKPYPTIFAGLLFVFPAIEAFNRAIGTSVNTTIFANGLTAILVGIMASSMLIKIYQIRRKIALDQHSDLVQRSRLSGLIELGLLLTSVTILITLIIGYVGLARFLSYELVWVAILFSTFYFLNSLMKDSCEGIFSTHTMTGQILQRSMKLNERTLFQIATILAALFKSALIILLLLLLMNGTLSSSSPAHILGKIIDFLGGKGLERLNIVPSHLVMALITLAGGIYVLRSIRRWLDIDFLPKTTMDAGMRASLVTLFSNIGYVLIILLTLSAIGVQWNKLAWIVSALSVGIGFGLQEIVKNFISGLILLTERPIKVGDLVGISGIEGDIRRINVRATEIQLSDKSTVIVPNSQLISQNVRNATMGNAQGVVTISLTFPLDVDPVRVQDILLGVFKDNEKILETPAPSVTFKDLSAQGILLSVTGNVMSQRLISVTKSDLLFEILVRLRHNGIALSSPQTMVIEQKTAPLLTSQQVTE